MKQARNLSLALCVASLTGALASPVLAGEPASFEPPQAAETLSAIAPSVVSVRRGTSWGTGFVWGTRRHIITSYFVVDAPGDLQIVARDGLARDAKVVAWSKNDDLAVLEVDTDLPAPPLEPSRERPAAAASVAALYEPRDPDVEPEKAGGWILPVAGFGHIGRVADGELDLDLNLWGRHLGAPIITPSGRLLGVMSHRSIDNQRVLATRVDRVERLFAIRGQQGEFSRHFPFRGFYGIFVSPVAAKGLVGAGFVTGVRYRSLLFSLTDALFLSDHRPVEGGRFESIERFQIELDAGVELPPVWDLHASIAPGVQLNLDGTTDVTVDASGQLQTERHRRATVRPALTLGFVESMLFVQVNISKTPRLDLGLMFGR